jgi:hypothetical protein
VRLTTKLLADGSGSANILSHPRDIPTLVRRPDDARATKRAARAERKAAERAAAEEEIRKQKGQKRREMEKGLKELKDELKGVEGLDWSEIEGLMEGDWEEGKWDEVVGRMLARAAEAEVGDQGGRADIRAMRNRRGMGRSLMSSRMMRMRMRMRRSIIVKMTRKRQYIWYVSPRFTLMLGCGFPRGCQDSEAKGQGEETRRNRDHRRRESRQGQSRHESVSIS